MFFCHRGSALVFALLILTATVVVAQEPGPSSDSAQDAAIDSAARPVVAPSGRIRLAPEASFEPWYTFASKPPFFGPSYVPGKDSPRIVHPGNARFAVGDEPRIPEALRTVHDPKQPLRPGYWIVHFRGGVTEDAHQLLDDVTGETRGPDGRELARWYVPNRALIAWVTSWDDYAEIQSSPLVDWMGPYHPAYKLDPTIGTVELQSPTRRDRDTYFLNVDLMPGVDVIRVGRELERRGARIANRVYLPGKKNYDVHFIVVEVAPNLVVDVARVEGVRFVQETGDGKRAFDISGGGKIQNRSLSVDDQSAGSIVNATDFPLWLTHNLQGQGQLIGVVDSSIDWNNTSMTGCNFGFPDTAIDNWGFALPNLSSVLLTSVGSGGVNLKIPRADVLGGATLQGSASGNEHGSGVAGAALADFYGNNDQKWWEHDVDNWDSWAPTNFSGLLGPGIAHEAQLYFTPVDDNNGGFRWEFVGEFESNMNTTLTNMAAAGVCTTNHSVGLAEANNNYSQTSVVHDTTSFDNPGMLQCMAAGNDGAVANAITSQAVTKNGLAVGASDDVLRAEDRVTFSSIGPTFDGRFKPDVMAPGSDTAPRANGVASQLILPNSNGTSGAGCAYQFTQGTSFAAPIIAGAGALVHQYFEEGRYAGSTAITDPSAALMKAMLVNGGHRLIGANLGNGQYPNFYQGWGEPKLTDVLDLPGTARRLAAYDVSSSNGFSGPGSADTELSNQRDDLDGAPSRHPRVDRRTGKHGKPARKLINDLHLEVTSPGGTLLRGNVFGLTAGTSVAGGSADTDNNVENVIVASPLTGSWTVTVRAGDGNYSLPQGYALVVTGDISEGSAPPAAPVADFTGTPTSGNTPLTVSFSDASTGSISSRSWNFGDGATSSATNPSHTYTAAGAYTVTLTVAGPGGSDTRTRTNYINVATAPTPPTANFTATPTSGETPLVVAFSDTSSGSISSYSWNFGDGGTSTSANPSHTYTVAGTYTVSLTATGPGGSDTETKTNLITVTSPPTGGTIWRYFSFTNNSVVPGLGTMRDEDIVRYDPATGTWEVYFDGSDMGLGGTDINAFSVMADGSIIMSFTSAFSVSGLTGGPSGTSVDDSDLVRFSGTTGSATSGTMSFYFDGSDVGLSSNGEDVDGVCVSRRRDDSDLHPRVVLGTRSERS